MKLHNECLKDFKDVKSKQVSLDNNALFRRLSRRVGVDPMIEAFKMYDVGTVNIWGGGSPAFWYKDVSGKVKSVKVEAYNEETGKPRPLVARMQRLYNPELDIDDYPWCYFGEHLLNQKPNVPVMVVEDERSAVFGGGGMKNYVWLSTGEPFSEKDPYRAEVLSGRDVVYITLNRERVPRIEGLNNARINAKYLVLDEESVPSMKRCRHEDLTDLLFDSETRHEVHELLKPEKIQRLLGKEYLDERRSGGFRR